MNGKELARQAIEGHERFSMALWHGEGATLYYLVDLGSGNDDDWAVIRTYHDRLSCMQAVAILNRAA